MLFSCKRRGRDGGEERDEREKRGRDEGRVQRNEEREKQGRGEG